MMQVLYFGWVRARIGHGKEELELPANIDTVAGLIDWLKSRGDGYARAFEDAAAIRAAVNQDYVPFDHPVADGDEIAFFPPVTGG